MDVQGGGLKLLQGLENLQEDQNTIFKKIDSIAVMRRCLTSPESVSKRPTPMPGETRDEFIERKIQEYHGSISGQGYDLSCVCVRTQPLIDILSVTIRKQSDCGDGSWLLGGEIYAHDGTDLENKDVLSDQKDISVEAGALSLSSSVVSVENPVLKFDIQDRATGATIINSSASLVSTTDTDQQEHQFEQFHTVTVPGSACSAEVEYLALTFGAIACVQIRLSEKKVSSNEGKDIDVYGKIHATYNLYHCGDKVHSITLFELMEDSDASNKVKTGSYINLSRSKFGVPAYSPLTIHVELWDRAKSELIVKGSCVFDTFNQIVYVQNIFGQNSFDAVVSVTCREPFSLDESWAQDYVFADPEFTCIPPSTESVAAIPQVDVFSVIIGRQSEEQLRLYGLISLISSNGTFVLFLRDKTDPFIMPPGCKKLPLEGFDRAIILGDYFFMGVNLEDVEGRLSIKGFMNANLEIRHRRCAWYDRLLCTIVKGTDLRSFAAIHYTVFSHALEAGLKIRFQFNGVQSSADFCKIHGCIVAYYGEYGCETAYERLYFRGEIFVRAEDNPLRMPCKDFDMDLSRTALSVPYDSPMKIAVDLSCQLNDTIRLVRGDKEFPIGSGVGSGATIAGDGEVSINITINWDPPMSKMLENEKPIENSNPLEILDF